MSWRAALDKWLRISVRRKLLEDALESQSIDYGSRVLEIGAGRLGRRGNYSPRGAPGGIWFSLDIQDSNCPTVQADLHHLPFADGVFDGILCLEVLEYLYDPQQAVRQLQRVSISGAQLVISVPFMHRQDSDRDYWRFSAAALSRLLEESQFTIQHLLAQGGAFAVAANIFKYRLNLIRNQSKRLWLGLLFRPLINFVWGMDVKQIVNEPVMGTFTTGFLGIATQQNGIED